MNQQEARIIVLEHELRKAYSLVYHLHSCLTNYQYEYRYPDETVETVKSWEKLVKIPHVLCHHSKYHDDCYSCKLRIHEFKQLETAKRILEGK